ncbi:MAG: hypothetical protein JNL72_03565 [Flavipsychrobacter sp.]|nr:hypothetical protein [Flavipsychrobacter sp.]
MTTIKEIHIAGRRFILDRFCSGYLADIIFPYLDNKGIIYFEQDEVSFTGRDAYELKSALSATLKELLGKMYTEPDKDDVRNHPSRYKKIRFNGVKYTLNYRLSPTDRVMFIINQLAQVISMEGASRATVTLYLSDNARQSSTTVNESIPDISVIQIESPHGKKAIRNKTYRKANLFDDLFLLIDFPFVYYYSFREKHGIYFGKFDALLIYCFAAAMLSLEYIPIQYPKRIPVLLGVYLLLRFYRNGSVTRLKQMYDGYRSGLVFGLKMYSLLLLLLLMFVIFKHMALGLAHFT